MTSNKPYVDRTGRWPEWTVAQLQLLGTMSDKEVARRVGRAANWVGVKRRSLGIPALMPGQRFWTASERALLGRVTDAEAARRLNRTLESVISMRSDLGIAVRDARDQPLIKGRATGNRIGAFWLEEEDALLGTMSDEKLAKKIGRAVVTVMKRRGKKGIRLYRKLWRPEDDKILGTRPDSQVAKLLGRRIATVVWRRLKLGIKCFYEHRPWLDHEIEMLGVIPDKEVARLTGHTESSAEAKRLRLKIPIARPKRRRWSEEEVALVGVISDRELARRLNCPIKVVAHKRRTLGLGPRVCRPWEDKEVELLNSKSSNEEVARLTGRTRIAVKVKRILLRRKQGPTKFLPTSIA
jgi:hypothetical protein